MRPGRAWIGAAIGLVGLAAAASRGEREPAPAPATYRVDRVLIVSVDGLGSDVLKKSLAPNIRALMARGSYTLSAVTTELANTLPSHTSMLTGVAPPKHGITWNDEFRGYPRFPTLMEVVKQHRSGLSTALVAGKAKFATFTRPGTVDDPFVMGSEGVDDAAIARKAASLILAGRANVALVHLPDVDRSGHAYGWGSTEQQAAVARADAAVGGLLDALRQAQVLDKTVLIVTADHGGSGKSHTPTDGVSRRIPWIIAGPGVRAGLDLAALGASVRVEDTHATARFLLGLPMDPRLDGKVVSAALVGRAVAH